MDFASIKPGIYRLTNDVGNPLRIDRRRVEWYFHPTFRTGMTFIVTDDLMDMNVKGVLSRNDGGFWKHLTMKRGGVEVLRAVAPFLEEIPARSSISSLILYYEKVMNVPASPYIILERMLRSGAISLDDVESHLKAQR